ncbi:TIGR02221 family CRISPR-associated protein [Desulfonatronovibrio magnus]|uniref:TIGR02221 family CRISPR-associated protein n=1 Tax=Desulfonatronovibrio magnus TaxID=698827 RepID=UPI0005EACD6F|nr:TIGR02221 family CRISPR-associated protein [Desulfonatronovibrio magnus]
MATKLISFLGLGFYDKVNYYYNFDHEVVGYETPFIQLALTHIFKPDEVVIFLTPEAEKMNWLGIKRTNSQGKEYPGCGLKKSAETLFPETVFTPVSIPGGQGEQEIWEIFESIHSRLDSGDQIIFDITHSFRSIPVIGLACLQYTRSLKDIMIDGIYYGNWEARTRNTETPSAPVENVTSFLTLMDWSHAVRVFQRHGQVEALTDLLEAEVIPRKKHSKGKDEEARILDRLSNLLNSSHSSISTCRGSEIYDGKPWEKAQDIINELTKTSNTIPAFYPLLGLIQNKLEKLQGPDKIFCQEVAKGFGAVEWCLEHGLVQQAYTLLQENIITFYCQKFNLNYQRREDRSLVSQGLSRSLIKIPEDKWFGEAAERPEIIKEIQKKANKEVCKIYDKITQNRNDINHAGTATCFRSDKLIKDIHDLFNKLLKCLSESSEL